VNKEALAPGGGTVGPKKETKYSVYNTSIVKITLGWQPPVKWVPGLSWG